MLPPLPTWDGLHPLVVHFPIALLIVAPVFVILALIRHRQYLSFASSALALMILGTAAAFVAVSSGEAAGELVMRTPEINTVLERHEELAETARLVFLGLTILFAAITFVPYALKRPLKRAPAFAVNIAFLLIYAGGTILLANTAHAGGRLVHEFGVQALVAETPPRPDALALRYPQLSHEHDDD
jgi:uncharacterized membrane protein